MQPSWQPDPTDRHDYRWWDGVEWTDQVSDRGVVRTDPGPVPAARPERSAPRRPAAGRSRLVPVVAALGVGVVVTGVFVALFRDRSATDLGTVEADLTRRGAFAMELELDAADMVRIRVEPDEELDVELAVVVPRTVATESAETMAADHVAELVEVFPELADDDGTAPARLDRRRVRAVVFPDAATVFAIGSDARRDHGDQFAVVWADDLFAGRPEAVSFVARSAGTYTVVVSAVKGTGPIRVIAERAGESYDREALFDPEVFEGDPFFTDETFYDAAQPYGG